MSTRRIPNDPFFGITIDTKLGRAIIELKDRTEEIEAEAGQGKYDSKVDDVGNGPQVHFRMDDAGPAPTDLVDRITGRLASLAAAGAFQQTGPLASGSASISLDQSNDVAILTNDPSLNTQGSISLTLECWFKDTTGSIARDLVTKDVVAGDGYALRVTAGDVVEFEVGDGVTTAIKTGAIDVVSDGAFHHIVAVRDSVAGELRVFVDGVLDGAAVSFSGLVDCSNSEDILIGGNGVALGIGGDLSNVVIYQEAMSAAQAIDIFNGGTLLVGDNLGNHTATQALDMAGFDIINSDVISNVGNMQIRPVNSAGLGSQVVVMGGTAGGGSNGGLLNLQGGTAGPTGDGGKVAVLGGTASGIGQIGGEMEVAGGAGNVNSAGGPVLIHGGDSSSSDGGLVTIRGGTAGTNDKGGGVVIKGEDSFGTNQGGPVDITGGKGSGGGSAGDGGDLRFTGGEAGAGAAEGGYFVGTGGVGGSSGGRAELTGGKGPAGTGNGGAAVVKGGEGGGSSGGGGAAQLLGGAGTGGNPGGDVLVRGGAADGGNAGGDVSILGGTPGSSGVGGKIVITASNSLSVSKGANVEITAGAGSGSGDGGDVKLKPGTTVSGVAGTVDLQDAGGTTVGRFDGNTTAGETRFFLYDVDNGTLERVTVGAADSGGVGFKVLRIPN